MQVDTAIDANIISALWSQEKQAPNISRELWASQLQGKLLVSPFVYVELLAYPKMTEASLHAFLRRVNVVVDFSLKETVWAEAGRRFSQYSVRRRKSGGGRPRRLAADFLIGAHALLQADRLMTMDAEVYRRNFPELSLIVF